jgi:hypothetical protein
VSQSDIDSQSQLAQAQQPAGGGSFEVLSHRRTLTPKTMSRMVMPRSTSLEETTEGAVVETPQRRQSWVSDLYSATRRRPLSIANPDLFRVSSSGGTPPPTAHSGQTTNAGGAGGNASLASFFDDDGSAFDLGSAGIVSSGSDYAGGRESPTEISNVSFSRRIFLPKAL